MTHKTGLLLIRAWVEGESSEPLRATIRVTRDVSHGIEETVTLTRPAEVVAMVARFLDQVQAGD